MKVQDVKPNKKFYIIPGAILIIGIGAFVILFLAGIKLSIEKIDHQVVVPGSEKIELLEPGKYTIYIEYRSVVDGKVYEALGSIDGLTCSLMDSENNVFIKLNSSSVNSSYSLPGREGKSILDFEIDRPGTYELKGWFEAGSTKNKIVLAVGKGFASSLVFTILLSIGVLLAGIGGAIGLFLYIHSRRDKAFKEKICAEATLK